MRFQPRLTVTVFLPHLHTKTFRPDRLPMQMNHSDVWRQLVTSNHIMHTMTGSDVFFVIFFALGHRCSFIVAALTHRCRRNHSPKWYFHTNLSNISAILFPLLRWLKSSIHTPSVKTVGCTVLWKFQAIFTQEAHRQWQRSTHSAQQDTVDRCCWHSTTVSCIAIIE